FRPHHAVLSLPGSLFDHRVSALLLVRLLLRLRSVLFLRHFPLRIAGARGHFPYCQMARKPPPSRFPMKRPAILCSLLLFGALQAADEDYKPGPDAMVKEG